MIRKLSRLGMRKMRGLDLGNKNHVINSNRIETTSRVRLDSIAFIERQIFLSVSIAGQRSFFVVQM